MHFSPATAATLAMLRVKVKPRTAAAPRKRPTGGRRNPVAEHVLPERQSYPCAPRKTRPSCVQASHENDFSSRFVRAVECGKIPVGVELTGAFLRSVTGNSYNGGWENVAATLAANSAPIRLVTVNRHRNSRPLFRVEFR